MTISVGTRDPTVTALTGDSFSQSGSTVTGVGSLFQNELDVGDVIKFGGVYRTVSSITNQLLLTAVQAGAVASTPSADVMARNVSRNGRQRLSLVSDDLSRPVNVGSVQAWLAGAYVVVNGVPVDGRSTVTANGLGGYDLVLVPGEILPPGDLVAVRVTAADTVAASTLDESWVFTTIEDLGPRINHAMSSPAPGSSPSSTPVTITVFVSDALVNALDFSLTGASFDYAPANQVFFTATGPNAGRSFQGLEGRRFFAAGQWRAIVSVQGPTLATYDGAPISGSSVNVDVYRHAGLDVVVDGQTVVRSGQSQLWGAVVTTPAGGAQVVMTPTTTWADGLRVPVFVRATDSDGDVSELSYDFLVGQAQGPVVSNISPAPGVRGLPVGPGASSDLAFRVSSVSGVALASVAVLVDGAAAVTAGVGVGIYSTSTLTPVTGGFDVVIKRSTAYADGRIVHVDVSCTDTVARAGERRVWSVQYGTATGAQAATAMGGEIPSDNVVRVCAYDLSDSSFCRPTELRHDGYAADGFWYESGSRTSDVASWFTALGQFPAGGQLVVTSDGGWVLLPTLAAAPWIQCAQYVGSGWNMAGNAAQPLLDGDFAVAAPVLALASALGVVTVDFAADRARLHDSVGRMTSAEVIGLRAANQVSGDVDAGVVIGASAVQRLALGAAGDTFVACQTAALTVVRGDVARSQPYLATWVRARVSGGDFALAYNDGGQGGIEVWTLDRFFAGLGMDELYDDMSTPALPSTTVEDIDIAGNALFLVTPAALMAVDRALATAATFTAADLALSGAGDVKALSACRDARADYGYVYVAADSPGRVTRFRLHWPSQPDRAVVVSDGVNVASLSAAGLVTDSSQSYLRLAMDIAL